MKTLSLLAALILLTTTCAQASPPISTAQAKDHLGQSAVVSGVVSDVHITAKGTALVDLDGRYPNQAFTAVWFASAHPPVAGLQALQGKTISVRGKISTYEGKPEIVLASMSQISD